MENIDQSLAALNDANLVDLLSDGNEKFNDKKDQAILISTIKFIKDSQRFAG